MGLSIFYFQPVMGIIITCIDAIHGTLSVTRPLLVGCHGLLQVILILFDGIFEKTKGTVPRAIGLIEYNDYIQDAGLINLKLTSPLYTWSNSSFDDSRIERKLDRILVNVCFL